ncbi:non-ribosomal peptide synthetase [Kibdelosporangium phytohabitans]|nr:non-ribosomal peptide synthetase [Kibdelosporangium phytohabitans]
MGLLIPQSVKPGDPAPLSYAQDGIWIADRLNAGEPTYTTPMAVRLRGPLSHTAMACAVADVVARHDALRTVIRAPEGRPLQFVEPSVPQPLAMTDLTGLPLPQRYPAALGKAADQARQYIDPAGPMGRFHLYRVGDDDHLLFLAVHHLVWDGWSISVFLRDLSDYYRSHIHGGQPTLPELPVQYADYAAWQREAGAGAAEDLEYWRAELSGDLAPFELPSVRPAGSGNAGAVTQLLVPEQDLDKINAFARAERVSLFMLLKTALHAVLHRLTGAPKVSTVFPWANRDAAELENLIGLFVNQLVLRTDCAEDPSFRALLRQVRGKALHAFRHAGLPFERLVRELGIDRDPSRNPLDQVRLGFQNATDMSLLDLPGVHSEIVELHSGAAKEKLDLVAWEQPAGLELVAAYNSDVFDELAANRLLRRLVQVMTAACADPERPVSELPLLVDGERAELLRAGETAARGEPSGTVTGLIAAQIARVSDAPAVVCGDESMSYQQLGESSGQLARVLRDRGVRRGDAVGIYLDRSIGFVIAVLGVLRAGGYYVPLDPAVPIARTELLLSDAEPVVVITSADLAQALPGPVVVLDALADPGGETDPAGSEVDYAYVVYTSGSTGTPKAATISHRAVVDMVRHQQDIMPLEIGARVAHRAPMTFDVSVIELFWTLCSGATLVVVPPAGGADVRAIATLADRQQVSAMFLVPSMVQAFLAADPPALPHLRALFCTGEALTPELIRRVRVVAPGVTVVNIYGATEASIYATTWSIGPGEDIPAEVPVGRPRPGVRCHVLDAKLRPVPFGTQGELYQSGIAVTPECGYLERPALTAERFLPDPFGTEPSARMYRSGDLVRMYPDGTLHYGSRADRQLKRHGVRIEPAEIQAALEDHPDVAQAHVMEHDGHLVAYIAASSVDLAAVRAMAAATLPRQLVPSRYVRLDRFPLTPNGKLDVRALPPPGGEPDRAGVRVAPRGDAERAVASSVAELLGLEQVWADDDFFQLGGTSLQGAELAYRLSGEFGTPVNVRAVFEARSVAELAARATGADQPDLAFAQDTRLDPAIAVDGVRPVDLERIADPRHVLLTGATGFLGAFMLHELLARTRAHVYCLVRASDDAAAAKRVVAALRSYQLDDDVSRVTALAGDLAEPRLGLGAEQFAGLAETVDAIFHNGARVNHLDSYARLRAPNVLGTVEVLRLATAARVKPVHFVSTIGLVYGTGDNPAVLAEDRRVPADQVLPNGYVASKWVAEELVHAAGERGIPVAVYRPSRVCGHSGTGAVGTDDAFWNLVRAMIAIGAAPDTGITADLVPVDHVAGAIVHLSRLPGTAGTTFHLTSVKPLPVAQVVSRVRAMGYPMEVLSAAQWQARLGDASAASASLSLVATQTDVTDALVPVVFGRTNTERALADAHVPAADVSQDLVDRHLAYLIHKGFIPAPQEHG